MATINLTITDGDDDGRAEAPFGNPAGEWGIYLGGGVFIVQGYDSSGDRYYEALFRFRNVQVPRGYIASATLTLINPNQGESGQFGAFRGIAADDAPAWTADAHTAEKTSASVPVTSILSGQNDFDVTEIVAEIVSRSGWRAGNALAIAGDYTGATDLFGIRYFESTPAQAAALTITFRRRPRHFYWLGRTA